MSNFLLTNLAIHNAFVGWITDLMVAAYYKPLTDGTLELTLCFRSEPDKLNRLIVSNEILTAIGFEMQDCGFKAIEYKYIVVGDSIGLFKETHPGRFRDMYPIFRKYEFMEDDLED